MPTARLPEPLVPPTHLGLSLPCPPVPEKELMRQITLQLALRRGLS